MKRDPQNKTQSMNNDSHMLFAGFIVASTALLLFSYTQVDLNLTLSRAGFWQGIQKAFQQVGYYQRPLSTGLFIGVVAAFFSLYVRLLFLIRKNRIGAAPVWMLIYIVTGVLVFSYPAAFSYDFFNYLFTAKTVLVYHQNPYLVTPLSFSGIDPWTNFMRWTHLPSAYTPLWIGLSLFPYALGLGYFLTVLFATKFMVAGFYILACWALYRTLSIVANEHKLFGLAFFALNPLILTETLVSGHNDIVLVAFALLSVWLMARRAMLWSWFFLALSIAAKLMTVFLIPVYILNPRRTWMLGGMLIGLTLVFLQREFLPWYWVWILPFAALNIDKSRLIAPAVMVSTVLVLSYGPYLYFGEYSAAEQVWKLSIIRTGVSIALFMSIFPLRRGIISGAGRRR